MCGKILCARCLRNVALPVASCLLLNQGRVSNNEYPLVLDTAKINAKPLANEGSSRIGQKMIPKEVEAHFTHSNGTYGFARWGRPIAPIVFGVEDATLSVLKGAIEAVVALANHEMVETDPELGSNLMFFFCRDWSELLAVPDLDKLVPELGPLVSRLSGQAANQYRIFRFDEAGAIKACFVFLRIDQTLADMPAQTLCLSQAIHIILLWSEAAFSQRSPLAILPGGKTVLRPEIADLVRAGYDPVLPDVANDPAHALRLAARISVSKANAE